MQHVSTIMTPSWQASDAVASLSNLSPAAERKAGMQLRPLIASGARAATVLLSSVQCPGQAHSDFIQPEIALSYESHAIDSRSGAFSARISLCNRASHIAHQPFLCLPILGLQMSPANGWNMQDVSSIRRLRRFGQETGKLLEPGASIHSCTIALLFNASDGGKVEFEAGSWHSVKALPDLRVTCVAGAGNFPSERLPLVIPAAAIRTALTSLIGTGHIPDGMVEF